MSQHGTPSWELGQVVKMQSVLTLALASALEGLDPKPTLKIVDGRGEALGLHMRQFFAPPSQQTAMPLVARYIVPIPNVLVNYDRKFVDAAMAGAPNTPPDCEALKIGDSYAPKHASVVHRNITLVNFPPTKGVDFESVLQVGRERKWGRVIDPWECLAVSELQPNLNHQLGVAGLMTVVSLEQFIFQSVRSGFQGQRFVTGVEWSGAERVVGLYEPERPLFRYFWFGFVSES